MAFVDFGSFLKGMRLSASDIADEQKAALNKRYMEEQMQTMQLGREHTQLQMEDARQTMGRRPVTWGREDYDYNTQFALPAVAGELSMEQVPDPGAPFRKAREAENARRKFAGVPLIADADLKPITDAAGKPTGRWTFVDESGKPTGSPIENADDAAIAAAEKLRWKAEGVIRRRKDDAELKRLREQNKGSGGKIKGLPVLDDIRTVILNNTRRMGDIDKLLAASLNGAVPGVNPTALAAEREKLAAANDEYTRLLVSTPALYSESTGADVGPTLEQRAAALPGRKSPAAVAPPAKGWPQPPGTPRKTRYGTVIPSRDGDWMQDPKTGRWGRYKKDANGRQVIEYYGGDATAPTGVTGTASGKGSNGYSFE